MNYTKAGTDDIAALRSLWREAFADPDAYTDAFFKTVFPTCDAFCARDGAELTAMLFALPQTVCRAENDEKAAFLYAFAVKKAYQNQGIGTKLLEFAVKNLKKKYVSCIYLACETERLADFYRKRGFYGKNISRKTVLLPPAEGEAAVISAIDYAGLRETLLFDTPHIRHPKPFLDFLSQNAVFYRLQTKNAFGCACTERENGRLKITECLPDASILPALAAALGSREAELSDQTAQFLFFSEKEPPYCAFPLD